MAEDDPKTEPGCTGRKRRPRDREPAALAIASGQTIKAAAEVAHVSERAVHGWLRDAAFVARVRELRAAMFGAAVGRLADLSGKAAGVLGGLLDSEAEGVRRQAAVNVLELGTKLRESVDLADEVGRLRAILGGDASDVQSAGGTDAAAEGGGDPGAVAGDAGDVGGPAG